MAGWERTGTDDAPIWVLEFAHRPGLVVRCTVPSLRARVLSARLAPTMAANLDRDGRGLLALAEVFAEDSLLDWNLTWGGRPRSADAAGIARIDLTLVTEILSTWLDLWLERPAEPEPEVDWSQLDALSVDLPNGDDDAGSADGQPAEPELAVMTGA